MLHLKQGVTKCLSSKIKDGNGRFVCNFQKIPLKGEVMSFFAPVFFLLAGYGSDDWNLSNHLGPQRPVLSVVEKPQRNLKQIPA